MRRCSCAVADESSINRTNTTCTPHKQPKKPRFMPSLFAEVFGLGGVLVVGNKLIGSRATDLGCFALIEQRGGAGSGAPADQPRRMGLGDGGVFVRAIDCPMHGVRGNAMEVAFLAEVARVSDEE